MAIVQDLFFLRWAFSTLSSSGSSGRPRAFLMTLVVRTTLVVTLETLPPIRARPSRALASVPEVDWERVATRLKGLL